MDVEKKPEQEMTVDKKMFTLLYLLFTSRIESKN